MTSSIVHSRYWSISSTNKVFILEMSHGLRPTLQKYSGEWQVVIAMVCISSTNKVFILLLLEKYNNLKYSQV
jgi:hypothetical protein